MSIYSHDLPFTSNLQMWSPTPSMTIDFKFNATSSIPFTQPPSFIHQPQSKFFHHESVSYLSSCIICGLPHHPVPPHTAMQYQTASPVITTPAPIEPTQYIASPRIVRQRARKQPKAHKRMRLRFKYIATRVFRIVALIVKAPLNTRRHNIYPVKQDITD